MRNTLRIRYIIRIFMPTLADGGSYAYTFALLRSVYLSFLSDLHFSVRHFRRCVTFTCSMAI